MADATRLKKKAAEFEAKRQYDRAIAAYEEILMDTSGAAREADIPLYNRLGDLHLRVGNQDRALTLYEKAVDMYAELGFFNNAIALCNKILRHAPNRASIYYKLGKISAKKGFNSDAKQNFLEYASRMQRGGKTDEAFRALKEFADLCPGQDDVRLMLADQLQRVGRKTEALEQLQILHEQLDAEGRAAEAVAAVERMRAINPAVEPRRSRGHVARRADDLIFLDLSEDTPPQPPPPPLEGLEPTSLTETLPPKVRPLTPQEFAIVDLPAVEEEKPFSPLVEPELALPPIAEPPFAEPEPEPAPPSPLSLIETLETPEPPPVEGLEPTAIAEPSTAVETPPTALEVAPTAVEEPPPPQAATALEESAPPPQAAPPPAPAPQPSAPTPAQATPDDDFLDLGEWLRADEAPRSTRMVTDAEEPAEGEQADFDEMLQKFKQGIAQNVDAEDYGSHYDLGVAFKEMGLLDEAIAEFQKALRGPEHRVATYEALGQCFVEKKQYEVAITLLSRALREPTFEDEQGLGVLYLLGYSNEMLGRHAEAASFYHRVFAVDIRFRDVSERLAAVSQGAP